MGSKHGFMEIYRRETGQSRSSRYFTRQISANEGFVTRLDLYRELEGHNGKVQTVEFNSSGNLLMSGSRDRTVIFWNWEAKTMKLRYASGHYDYVLHTRIMPFSDDTKIATASTDSQVRIGEVREDGRVPTRRLGRHKGGAYRLAVEPGNPNIIYSCGADAFVQHFDVRSSRGARLLCCPSLSKNCRVGLYDIVVPASDPNYICTGGEDQYARLYDVRRLESSKSKPVSIFCPNHLIGKTDNNICITGLAYSNATELLVNYSDENIYLFQKNMGMGLDDPISSTSSAQDMASSSTEVVDKLPQAFLGRSNAKTLKGVSFLGPNDEYVMSGGDCGSVFIWKKKGGKVVHQIYGDFYAVNQVEPHPHIPAIASCGVENKVKLWAPMATPQLLPWDNALMLLMRPNRHRRSGRILVS